ncbi:cytochrome P450 [Streptomyces griseoviridis]|uniref:Cytochrome P450 n=1 Tax=Streptomyces griseoviridis TaxID=45398 RepID=A0A3Q9KLT0_STRGD|nr:MULTISPECIES: cytochrome P450 [Streptomyces]AZS83508.1 cytochrome P450 [Streptomyces griseoviridis]MDH6696308.1 cytochrome P450 [Streptomyces sp. MAA16]QCN89639.1 cytochrome P450 [Streptomyces griseoviridis]
MTETLPQMPVRRATRLDPPVEYDSLREDRPVTRVRFPNGLTGWLVTRFEEGSQVFADPRMSAMRPRHDTRPGEATEAGQDAPFDPVFVMMDEPDHSSYRRLLAGRFTPKSVAARLQPYLDRIVDEHLDAIAAGPETFDFVEAMALPIPCLVICELLGVPYADRDGFHHATQAMMDMSRSREERDRGAKWLIDYITQLVADKRRSKSTEGLIAELIRIADAEGSIVTDRQLIGMGVLLLFAGHDTTAAMMGLSTLTLLTHPEQRRKLLADPDRTAGPAVEELMRYLTIVQFGLGRVAKEDLELGGQHIREGDLVVVGMNAANRDPRTFDAPDTLDFDRKIIRHLAFGYGVHQCLGQNIARAELKTVLPRVFARFPELRLAVPAEQVPMDEHGTNYGVLELMVTR